MALTLTDVGHVYGEGTPWASRALDGIGLELERGGLTVVLGPTGSGKSTLMLAAAGLLRPTEGTVACDGRLPGADGFGGLVGLVFQDPETQLFAETVLDDVAFGPRNLGIPDEAARDVARDALSRVGLDPPLYEERSPFTLSGGEARRAAIAGVMAMGVDYLLLDEPTAGLDADGRSRVRSIVAEARDDAGVLVVTHDAEEFLPHADRVVVLEGGRVLRAGDVADVLSDTEAPGTGRLAWPEVVRVQWLARERAVAPGRAALDPPPTLDVADAAERLARALEAAR